MRLCLLKLTIVFVLSFIFSCNKLENVAEAEYTKSASGFLFKHITIGDGNHLPALGDSLFLKILWKNDSEDIFISTILNDSHQQVNFVWMQRQKSAESVLNNCFAILNEGDSVHFIVDLKQAYTEAFHIALPDSLSGIETIRMEVKLNKIKTANQIKSEARSIEKWQSEMKMIENDVLKEYLIKNKIMDKPDTNGIVIFNRKKTNGPLVLRGKTIFVKYSGRFLNGKVFDDAFRNYKAFEYKVGTPNQFIKGLEILIANMRFGEKCTAIIPSELAFGSKQSSSGLIPPFTSVIYEIEIIN